MSRRTFNRTRELQPQQPPPPHEYYERSIRRGGVLGANLPYEGHRFYRDRRNSFYQNNYRMDSPIRPPYFYRRTFYNRNYGQYTRQRQPQRQDIRNQDNVTQKSRIKPNPLTLGDFLSSNSTEGYGLTTTTNALPQRQQSTRNTTNDNNDNNNNNGTQPFVVNEHQNKTTSAYRRRQRRKHQQQINPNQINGNGNRFALLAGLQSDVESDIDENNDNNNDKLALLNKKSKKKFNNNNNNNKMPSYLHSIKILKHFKDDPLLQDNRTCDANKDYMLNSAPCHNEIIRAIYEIQLWKFYLTLGVESNHWAKEIVRRTKKRDNNVNRSFITKKMNQLLSIINRNRSTISELQIQLTDYWTQISTRRKAARSSISTSHQRLSTDIEQFDNSIKNYIKDCTKHVKNMIETRIQLAKVEMEEYNALTDFQKSADPLHWHIHLSLKPKIKAWSVKNKNNRIAQERITHNLLPKFINNVNLDFKIDESALTVHEVHAAYNKMHVITHTYRTDAMQLYVKMSALESDSVKNEINTLIKSFPKGTDEQTVSYDKFIKYNELREKRLELELKQSCYFLEVERIEGENNLLNESEADMVATVQALQWDPDLTVQI